LGSTRIQETVAALKHCQRQAKFYSTLYLTDALVAEEGINLVSVDNIPSYLDYQKFVVKSLPSILLEATPKDFDGHYLLINWDGFIVNPSAWRSDFLKYDYIGAPWPWMDHAVGNGGFCLKSKKFISTQRNIISTMPNDSITQNEDLELCTRLRPYFEEQGCVYATSEVAYQFSTEHGNYQDNQSFGFHDFKCQPQFIEMINSQNTYSNV
jgi:hypothetical protein